MAQENDKRDQQQLSESQLDSLYMNALNAIDGARKHPTDMGIYIANGHIDRFVGEYNKLGNNPPTKWRMKYDRLAPYLPQEGIVDYSGYEWKNLVDPNLNKPPQGYRSPVEPLPIEPLPSKPTDPTNRGQY